MKKNNVLFKLVIIVGIAVALTEVNINGQQFVYRWFMECSYYDSETSEKRF